MDTWHLIEINHTQKNAIHLYCKEDEGAVQIRITSILDDNVLYLVKDVLIGSVVDLSLNQNKEPIEWKLTKNYPESENWTFNMLVSRERDGHQNGMDFLKYHIANAMNKTQKNRGFSKYAKKKIIGKWGNGDSELVFDISGRFFIKKHNTNEPERLFYISEGDWNISSNMLVVWDSNLNSGSRQLLVDVFDDKLIFLGDHGQLFYTFERIIN
ncbi:hypothetical protein [Algivirga pacifica]|uniref:Uncharacterized protein n=1 Tax=Algivirga pacifica TaxID=1162670 RepID=A0ABP9DJH9_9BACT